MDKKTFSTTVEDVGAFIFRVPRTLRDEIRIATEVSRLTEGVDTPSQWLAAVSEMVATLKVLTAEHPEDWDIDGMDPLDPATYQQISEVFGALRAAEERFRRARRGAGQARGPGDGRHDPAVVPPPVQPPA